LNPPVADRLGSGAVSIAVDEAFSSLNRSPFDRAAFAVASDGFVAAPAVPSFRPSAASNDATLPASVLPLTTILRV
jgi:hypothetical protein